MQQKKVSGLKWSNANVYKYNAEKDEECRSILINYYQTKEEMMLI